MNVWVALYRFAWGLLVAISLVAVVVIFVPRYHRLKELHRQRVELEQENRGIEYQIQALKDNQRFFQSEPQFVELVAREAGMIKTNEVVYRLNTGQSK